ncbi:hypothetical protein F5B19DRAFT_110021 [Rostrohypoxylon terebratum]|nr:hypothetical protein F5B19DRAFT_110021 [Rostrohypoxylon terebratum]
MKLISIWWLEIASCVVVVAMIAALAGTVQPYSGQPLSRWPYSFPINTIVSFYAEVMRAALVLVLGECLSQLKWSWFTSPRPLHHMEHYDSASRGPWGSLKLLWAIRLRAILPSLGGIIMILSLIVVPFTQQIVQFYNCNMVDTTLNASVPTTHIAYSGHSGATQSIVASAQAVINSGVYSSELKQPSFVCSTGNCTFEVYHSIGWCSHCEDISDQLEIQYADSGLLTFTLPSSNLSATEKLETFVMGAGGYGMQAILGWTANGTSRPLSQSPWGKRGFGAAECYIGPCVRDYRGIVQGGRLSENFTSMSWNPSDDIENGQEVDYVNVPCLNASETQSLHDAGYNLDPQTTAWFRWTGLNLTRDVYLRPDCVYQSYGPQLFTLREYLTDMFTGKLEYAVGDITGPPILQTIYQEGNVTYSTINDMYNRIAQGLTAWAREQGSNVTGQVWRSDTCVYAHWQWVAYPTSLIVGTVVFLVWTIDRTRKEEGSRQDYKSSPLAFLFHRLGSVGSEGLVSNIGSNGELQEKAKTMRVVFHGTDDVWRFTEVEESYTPATKKRGV